MGSKEASNNPDDNLYLPPTWTLQDFLSLKAKHKFLETNVERFIDVANIIDQDKNSELMLPEEIEALKADILEVNQKNEFGLQKNDNKRMWRASKFKMSKEIMDVLKLDITD